MHTSSSHILVYWKNVINDQIHIRMTISLERNNIHYQENFDITLQRIFCNLNLAESQILNKNLYFYKNKSLN